MNYKLILVVLSICGSVQLQSASNKKNGIVQRQARQILLLNRAKAKQKAEATKQKADAARKKTEAYNKIVCQERRKKEDFTIQLGYMPTREPQARWAMFDRQIHQMDYLERSEENKRVKEDIAKKARTQLFNDLLKKAEDGEEISDYLYFRSVDAFIPIKSQKTEPSLDTALQKASALTAETWAEIPEERREFLKRRVEQELESKRIRYISGLIG